MVWTPESHGLDVSRASSADTVLFVDVDGVLNVGSRDGDVPVLINETGLGDALKLYGKHRKHPLRDTIERLVSISRREPEPGEGAIYAQLACPGDESVSGILLGRLCELIKAAGEQCIVVLSSKWQKYKARVRRLEADISRHLGLAFAFDAQSGIDEEGTPESRLQFVGRFLEGFCDWRGGSLDRLRVLMLEDFHITALNGSWTCDGTPMGSTADAEQYLRGRMPHSAEVSVRLIHTYDEWFTDCGLLVEVGCGLTKKHFHAAAEFLSCEEVEVPSAEGFLHENGSSAVNSIKGCSKRTLGSSGARPLGESPQKLRRVSAPAPRRKACKPQGIALFKAPELSEAG